MDFCTFFLYKFLNVYIEGTGAALISFIENNSTAVLKVDASGVILSANATAYKIFGYPEDFLTGCEVKKLFPASAREETGGLGVLSSLTQSDRVNTLETVALRGDDTEFSVEVVLSAVNTNNGKVYVCQVRDISGRQFTDSTDSILHTTLRRVLRGQTPEQFCPSVCEKLVDLLDCPLVWIGTKEDDGSVNVCAAAGVRSAGFPEKPVRWDDPRESFGPSGYVIRSKKTTVVSLDDDKAVDEDGREHTRQIICFPLVSHKGVEGVLEIHSAFGKMDLNMLQRLETFSLRLALSLQIAKDQKNLRLQEASLISSPTPIFFTDTDGVVFWVNKAFTKLSGYREEEILNQKISLLKSGIQDAAFYNDLWSTIKGGKTWRGEIVERHKTGSLFTVEQVIAPVSDASGAVSHYVAIQEDVTERKNAEGRIQHLANYDQLTGLPNRRLFHERLVEIIARAEKYKTKAALIFADLTNFNRINDTLGHSTGDKLLKAIADRLSRLVSNNDFLARIGGDEFAIISENIANAEAVALKARSVIETILAPMQMGNVEVNVGACVGIAIYPDDETEPDRLVNFTDMALHKAVRSAPNSYFFFSQEMNAETEERLSLESDLRRALSNNEFVLYYQPQLDLKTGKVLSFEALIRWINPERGMVPPLKFIPIAEDTGLIIPIGNWVLKEALRQMKEWDSLGVPPICTAVNLSVIQFQQDDLAANVEDLLKQFDMSSERLELELTESVVMQDAQKAGNILSRLSNVGIKLAIDDFGTGYSSLSYLKRFAVNRLKIDQSFVRDMTSNSDDAEIAQAIINLGHTLGLEIVSEGVETPEQLALLRQQGCDVIQGYYIGKPMPAEQIPEFLRNFSLKD